MEGQKAGAEACKAYIEQFLQAYNVYVFNTLLSVFADLPPEKVQVITPTIDPFNEKNRYLTPAKGLELLAGPIHPGGR